jgi:two-component system KDP operon response regulator KdpE
MPNPQSDITPPGATPVRLPANGLVSRGTVLLVQRDAEFRSLVRFGLERQGFRVLEAETASTGLEVALHSRPGVVLLDLDVSDGDGPATIREFHEWTQIPLLALAGRVNSTGPVTALDHGAADYIPRPFNMEELAARLRAAQRQSHSEPEVFHSGSLSVELSTRTVKVENRTVNLSATEYSLLQCFIRNAGKVITHTQILREVWGEQKQDEVNYLRVYLLSLRKKLRNPPEPELFVTERSVGYRLVIRDPWAPALAA